MDIIMAEKAGYCYGIKNAMNLVEELLEKGEKPIYTLGDISHNRQEMQRLQKQGIIRLNSVEDADSGYLIIRTHGASKEEFERAKQKGLTIIDATCPHVRHVQERIQKYDQLGYQIIIIGDKNHPEIIGACGWAQRPPIVIGTIAEAEALGDFSRVCVVAQTTLIKQKFDEIVNVLEQKARDIKVFNTICTATGQRQKAAAELAENVDAIIVVGGYHSSNTRKLSAICSAHCKNTWHIETAEELDLDALKNLDRIGITAGASTPDWLIAEVIGRMEEKNLDQVVVADDEEQKVEESTDSVTEAVVSETEDSPVVETVEDVDLGVTTDEASSDDTEDASGEELQASEESDAAETIEETETVVQESADEQEEAAQQGSVEVDTETVQEDAQAEESTPVEEVVDETVEETSKPEAPEEVTPPTPEENSASDAEFDFAAEINNLKPVRKNSVVEGEVLSVSDDEVILNIGYKSDAVILRRDYTWKRDVNLTDIVDIGDMIKAIVTDLNDGDGRVKLSKIKYDNQKIQRRLGQAFEDQEILHGIVKSVSGSGLIVDVGFAEIFMPASQYHTRYVKDLDSLVGKEVRGKIIDYNAKRRRAILSQKAIIVEEREQRRKEQEAIKAKRYEELALDDIVTGKIKTITNFGIFIDLDGIDGFVHRSDLTWERFNEPRNVVERGQEIDAKVIEKKDDELKIKLSVKALKEKPFETFIKQYNEGDVVDVVITNTREFGAFAEIMPGVEGLIHISQISYDHVDNVDEILTPGQNVEVKILSINEEDEKISLSIKETLPVPDYIKRRRNHDSSNKKKRTRRPSKPRETQNYQEAGEFTIGDSFGDVFNNIDFTEEPEEVEEQEQTVEVSEEPTVEPEEVVVEAAEEPVVEETVQEPAVEESVEEVVEETVEEPVAEETVTEESVEEPVVEETEETIQEEE